jgi:hypothetical protein
LAAIFAAAAVAALASAASALALALVALTWWGKGLLATRSPEAERVQPVVGLARVRVRVRVSGRSSVRVGIGVRVRVRVRFRVRVRVKLRPVVGLLSAPVELPLPRHLRDHRGLQGAQQVDR